MAGVGKKPWSKELKNWKNYKNDDESERLRNNRSYFSTK
jgi:hypothetical protein